MKLCFMFTEVTSVTDVPKISRLFMWPDWWDCLRPVCVFWQHANLIGWQALVYANDQSEFEQI